MAISVTHAHSAAQSDGSDPSLLQPSHWNAGHTVTGALADPMTTRGDVIVRNASNTTARLGVGAAGKILSSDGTDVSWGNGPMTTADDIIIGGTSGLPTRLGKGSDGQVLTVDPSTHHLLWATPSSGFSNPMTTKGDLIIGDTGGSPIRKAIGSDTQVLTADSASTGGMKWAAGGGGGGVTVQYPGLKPGTPTYDFAGASMPGAFSAHSSQGSFVIGDCFTQGIDWMGSALEIQYSEQMGAIYVTHADTDLDFSVGGIRLYGAGGFGSTSWGIGALNSSGTGVGVLVDEGGNFYSCTITTWGAGSIKVNWSLRGFVGGGSSNESVTAGDVWMRITRVSGTWTYYASLSGRAWDKVFSTSADSVTVDRLAFGLFFNTADPYSARLVADYFHVAV